MFTHHGSDISTMVLMFGVSSKNYTKFNGTRIPHNGKSHCFSSVAVGHSLAADHMQRSAFYSNEVYKYSSLHYQGKSTLKKQTRNNRQNFGSTRSLELKEKTSKQHKSLETTQKSQNNTKVSKQHKSLKTTQKSQNNTKVSKQHKSLETTQNSQINTKFSDQHERTKYTIQEIRMAQLKEMEEGGLIMKKENKDHFASFINWLIFLLNFILICKNIWGKMKNK